MKVGYHAGSRLVLGRPVLFPKQVAGNFKHGLFASGTRAVPQGGRPFACIVQLRCIVSLIVGGW